MIRIWKRFSVCALVTSLAVSSLCAQGIPEELRGRWRITRTLPTRAISCWGDKEAKALLFTEIEYTSASFRWNRTTVKDFKVAKRIVTSQQYHDENSGQGSNSSVVTFQQLGIKAAKAVLISIEHNAAQINRATTEIAGDEVLLKDKNTIVFSVCSVYFEAKREPSTK